VLYLLIDAGAKGLSRKDFMDIAWVMNAPQNIMKLRHSGVAIICKSVSRVNKFGRDITYGVYVIAPTKDAMDRAKKVYLKMQQEDAKNEG